MTSKQEEAKEWFGTWAKHYDSFFLGSYLRYWQRKTVDNIITSGKILDVGCGTGYALEYLQQKAPKTKLYGIDMTPEMLDIARVKVPSAEFKEGIVQKLPYSANTFDYVFSCEAFHHYEHQLQSLQEMQRVCKKEGTVIITDPECFFRSIHWVFEHFEPGCVRVNTKTELKTLFEKVGFHHITQERIGLFGVITKGKKIL